MSVLAALARHPLLALGLALLLRAPEAQAFAQVPTAPASSQESRAARVKWPAPLDRMVVLHVRDTSLREALDRLAAVAHLRFSYSAELLPLDRSVRASFDSVTVGDALVELLHGTSLAPVVAGPDQVVLAPTLSPAAAADSLRADVPRTLERVVVTGSATGAPQRSLTVAVDVIRGTQLANTGEGTMAHAFDATVPGVWMWEQSPTSLLARYGSIRGASSFGVSYPKIYIDGIEVANPLLLTQFDPENVERIEVIRGPQGAALYGADAISGVVNIITRHDGVDAGEPRLRLKSVAGASQSDFVSGAVLSQEHTLAFRTGSTARSANLDLAVGSLGAFYPGASSRHVMATGGMRLIGEQSSIVGTARFLYNNAGAASNPLLDDVSPPSGGGPGPDGGPITTSTPQTVKEYTLGATARWVGSERWTHSLVVGIDGYRLTDVAHDFTPFPSKTDSALRAARGGADRLTTRVSSVAQLRNTAQTSASVTLAAEQSLLREDTFADDGHGGDHAPGFDRSVIGADWLTSSGITAQTDLAFHDALFLTGGLRIERSTAYLGAVRYSTLPMIGAAFVRDIGDITVKLRSAYGKGIRAPRTASRTTMMSGFRPTSYSLTDLGPETQSGVEIGLDLFVGRMFTFQLTRFDQRATGLIQNVALADSMPGSLRPRVVFQLQNVGAIANHGWEMQGTAQRGRFALTTSLSLVDSRVQRLATGYSGDLQAGDRMFDVPAQTVGFSASWSGRRWFGSVTAARAFDWMDYDRLALANDVLSVDRYSRDLVGQHLRDYWRKYDGVTRLRASGSRTLARGISLVLTGDNLLDQQRGEPDNVTILPGRTITAGFRVAF